MTSRYARMMTFYCDTPGCKSETDGLDTRLPPGWTAYDGPEGVLHRCPGCSAKEVLAPDGPRMLPLAHD